ncbi:MAG: RNA ligase (ATP) [Chitinophagales bacterium]|nr:RNA ligase (ATP) [Chitinophagales bacterium]
MSKRKLATVRKIAEVRLIEGANKICAYRVDGWWVVDSIDKYKVNDAVVYAEPDSWVPHSLAPFLTKEGQLPKVYNEVEGQRLRTVKLRGQISQGLLLPVSVLHIDGKWIEGVVIDEGTDVTEILGVQKWEPPAEFRAANAKGSFPHFIPKTDCERVQNLSRQVQQWAEDEVVFQKSEKLDGSSMTVFYKDGEVGCCSRNLELKDDGTSTFWETAKSEKLVEKLISLGKNIALQGELLGGQIQGNSYKITGFKFFLYDIYDIDKQEYLRPEVVEQFAEEHGISHVPVIGYVTLPKEDIIQALLLDADGKSAVGCNPKREGFVYKSTKDTSISVKCISNSWLLSNDG